MKNQIISLLVVASFLMTSACSSMSAKKTKFELRPVQEKTLANGLRIIFIPDSSLPRVGLALAILTGSSQDPKGREGLMNMTADLLEQGTKNKTATEIADSFAQLGSSFGAAVAQDFVSINTAGLSATKTDLANLFAEVILNPTFAAAEVERLRSQNLAQIAQMKDQPSSYADILSDQEIFGTHPYANPGIGQASSVKAITRAHIIKNYFSYFRPNNAILAVTGNYDEQFKSQIEALFSAWEKKEIKAAAYPELRQPEKLEMKLVSKAALQQAQIRFGRPGIARNSPDFLTLRLANLVLGGAFASRLNQKVRDDLGLTYSISSRFESLKNTGSFEISTFTRNDKVGETIKSALAVVKEFKDKGVTDAELDAAKALLSGQFPAAIETVDRLAYNLLILRVNGIDDSYLKDFFVNVNSISKKQVNEAIKKYFSDDKMKILIYADETKVAEQLTPIGAVEIVKAQ